MTYNIIADIGGQFDPLIRLIAKMPKADKTILVGDLNDRGPQSRQVIEWAMSDLDIVAVDSNHGHMFVDMWRRALEDDYQMEYHPGDFINNGGAQTLASYGAVDGMHFFEAMRLVPASHIQWLDQLPWKFEAPGLVVTHAPIPYAYGDSPPQRHARIWNRGYPHPIEGTFQVYGHNAANEVRWFVKDGITRQIISNTPVEGAYACCIDASRQRDRLTGMHWPTKEIFQEVYDDKMALQKST